MLHKTRDGGSTKFPSIIQNPLNTPPQAEASSCPAYYKGYEIDSCLMPSGNIS